MTVLEEEKQKRAQGSRGKSAEDAVKKYLTGLGNRYAEFDWARIYDARSAGGRFPSRPGDFEFYRLMPDQIVDNGASVDAAVHGLIEVKEVNHEFRLPAKNLKKEQIAKLRKRELAGGTIVILIYHTPLKGWRRVPLSFFAYRAAQPSWDLTNYSLFASVEEAIQGLSALR